MPTAPGGTSIDLAVPDRSGDSEPLIGRSTSRSERVGRTSSRENIPASPHECLSWFPGEISLNEDLIARIDAACVQPTYRTQNVTQVVYTAIREWFETLDAQLRDRVLTTLLAHALGHVHDLRTENTERIEDSQVVVAFVRQLLLGACPSEGSLIDRLAGIRAGVSNPPIAVAPTMSSPGIAPLAAEVQSSARNVLRWRANSHEPLAFAHTIAVSASAVIAERDLIQDPLLRAEILGAFRELFGETQVTLDMIIAIIRRIDATDLLETFDSPANEREFLQSAERELRIFSIVLDHIESQTNASDGWVMEQARERLLERLKRLKPLEVVIAKGEQGPELIVSQPRVQVVINNDVFILFSREGGVFELPIGQVMIAYPGQALAPKLLSATQARVLKKALREGEFGIEGSHNVKYARLDAFTAVTSFLRLPQQGQEVRSFTEIVSGLAQMTGTFMGRIAKVIRDESDFSDFGFGRKTSAIKSDDKQSQQGEPDQDLSASQPLPPSPHRHGKLKRSSALVRDLGQKPAIAKKKAGQHANVQAVSVMVRSLHSALKLHGGIELDPNDFLYYPIPGYKWKSPDDPHNFMIVPLEVGDETSQGKPDPYQGEIAVGPAMASSPQLHLHDEKESPPAPAEKQRKGWAKFWPL